MTPSTITARTDAAAPLSAAAVKAGAAKAAAAKAAAATTGAATTDAAKAEVLRRIRVATGGASDGEVTRAGWSALERGYKRRGTLERAALLDLLENRLLDYDAQVVRVGAGEVAPAVATLLSDRAKRRLLVPMGLPVEWMPAGFEFTVEAGMSTGELDQFEGVMTGATVAIAETGTVVLQGGPGQGRRAATLIPDYHLCVVLAEDVVETVPEAMERLQKTATGSTTFVSGPSATADIEMTRIKGVHGPRHLDVILVG